MTPDLIDALSRANPDTLVNMYIELRNKRNAARKIDKEYNAKMDVVGGFILNKMDNLGQDGFKANGFVVFKSELTTAKVIDREAFFNFIRESLMFDLLEARISKEGAEQFRSDNGIDPPGTALDKLIRLNVRKA